MAQLQSYWPYKDRIFSSSDMDVLLNFTESSGFDLVFDVNELYGRKCGGPQNWTCSGSWDSSNTKYLLEWFRDHPKRTLSGRLQGVEMGNELTRSLHINMSTNIRDYRELSKVFDSVWGSATTSDASRPELQGPSTDMCDETSAAFMEGTRPFLQAFNYHSYPARACKNHSQYYEEMFSPTWLRQSVWLNDLHANASECWRQWQSTGLQQAGVALQLTETNSCYDMDGPDMVGFANAFFYVASLGQTSAAGLRMHSRWNLYSQHFGYLQPLQS